MHLRTLIILGLSVLGMVSPFAFSQPVIGPSTVGTTTGNFAIGNSQGFNQGEFFANGLFWVYYTDGTNEVLRSSKDGVTWSSPTVIRHGSGGSEFSGTFDGTYFQYVSTDPGRSIVYRRGSPDGDGSITWSAPEQTVQNCGTGANNCDDGAIAVDSAGYVWISYSTPLSDCKDCLPSFPYVTRDANNDGTWSTDRLDGFPVQLSSTGSGGTGMGDWGETIVPLSDQQVYVLFGHGPSYLNGTGNSPIFGKLYNSGFGSQETATSSPLFANMRYSSAVTVGDNIYLVFLANDTQTGMVDVRFVERIASSGTWTPEVTIWPSITSEGANFGKNALALSKDGAGDLYLFWMGSPSANNIYYMKYTAATGTWDASPTDWLTETQTIPDNRNIMVYPEAYQGNLGVTYETGSASPYNIRFATLLSSITPTPTSTSYSTLEASTVTTSSTSVITTFATSTQSTTLSAVTNSPLVTASKSTTSTVTGAIAGTSTTIFTSILSTSTTTSLTTSSVGETTTQTDVTTVSTSTSTSTTTTETSFSTTVSSGSTTIIEADTFNVLLTTIFQELHQLADEFLQLIKFQPVATPVGQEVKQIIVTTTTAPTAVTMTVSYSVSGGGSPTAPVFHYVLKSASKSLTLGTSAVKVSVDAGSTWSVTPNPLTGSSSSQRWYSSQTLTGTASATTLIFAFQHQYRLTMVASGPGTISPSSGWYNSGQTVTITAKANSGHEFKSWTGSGTESYTGTKNPGSITMNSAITETATFT